MGVWRRLGLERRLARWMGRRANGIFLTTQMSPRIARHFERLRRQTRGLVDWHLVENPGNACAPLGWRLDPGPADLLPERLRQMEANGGLLPGYVDVLTVPLAASLPHAHTWVVEFDVDYAGDWGRFFQRFARNDADLLTSSILPLDEDPNWYFAPGTAMPAYADPACRLRAFHPVMRMSRRFLSAYQDEVRDCAWRGHFEFLVPTIARHRGLKIEDLGGAGAFCPPERRGQVYRNTPTDPALSPGSFVWRPIREQYFHEQPDAFEQADLLYHPVKVPAS